MSAKRNSTDLQVTPFIDGIARQSDSEAVVDVVNPSTGTRLISIPEGTERDVDHAVSAARRAFVDGRWSDAALSFRKSSLYRLAELLAKEGAALDVLDAAEMGKPVSTSRGNAAEAADLMRFYAEAIDKVTGDLYGGDRTNLVMQRRVPRGVVAAIVPWNFPTANAILKVAPALAAGNCVVLKPSELSSRSAVRIGQLAIQAGIPEGVLNIVPGLGETVGRALGLHRDVDMLAFTGSTEVGKMMLQYAGQSNMKAVQAECGGKSPQIIFADGVSVDAACDSIAGFLLTNQGQICSVGSRVLVHASIEKEVVDKLTARLKVIVMGDALDPQTTFGPLASRKQCERVMRYIEGAADDGCQLAAGGQRARTASGGFFVEPTIFRAVPSTAKIFREEIFGPVLAVTPFESETDAIRMANDTPYGLAAYVWTANLSTGMRLAKAMRSLVMINSATPTGEGPGNAASWEPVGESGFGAEGGLNGMETYMRRQLIWFSHA